VDPLSRRIECLEKSGLGIPHLRTEFFESVRPYKKENFD